jgi:hypothetical protein
MNRIRLSTLYFGVVVAFILAGCGGGGGGGGTSDEGGTPEPPATGSRILTGQVVSSLDSTKGVDGVVIRFGAFSSATTANGGKFELNIDAEGNNLPYYFQVDTSKAGANFPPSELVTYKAQTYYPDKVDLPIEILNGQSNDLGKITVREVTDDQAPSQPYPSRDTLIYGRVVSAKTGEGIEGVLVTFGYTSPTTAISGKNGYFVLNLGRDAAVLPLFPSDRWPPTFSINTSTATGNYPVTLQVMFRSQTSTQSSIPVPEDILLASETTSLGTITVLDDTGSGGGGGGEGPPPPPSF